MKVFITLQEETANDVARHINAQLVRCPEEADVSIIFLGGLIGEKIDPLTYISNPNTAGILAGPPTRDSLEIAEVAHKSGVPASNIIFTSTDGVTIENVQDLYNNLAKNVPEKVSNAYISFGKPSPNPDRVVKVPKKIGVLSTKGGTGRTTISTCLVEHYNSISEKAVLLDLCEPHNGKYHLANSDSNCNADGLEGLDNLTAAYRRVVVDTPLMFTDCNNIFDAIVLVIDSDVVQCIEPAASLSKDMKINVVIYNRKRAEVPVDLIKSYMPGVPVVTVTEDFIGCMAALSGGVPAIIKSEIIGEAVGKIAAYIDEGSGQA